MASATSSADSFSFGASGFTGSLEKVFGRAQVVAGGAMLVGSVAGGIVAQATNLGVPYILRAAMLGVTIVVALRFMRDIGFKPKVGETPEPKLAEKMPMLAENLSNAIVSNSTGLDPSKVVVAERPYGSKALIDACKPHRYLDQFPKRTLLRRPVYEQVARRWGELGFDGPPPTLADFHSD